MCHQKPSRHSGAHTAYEGRPRARALHDLESIAEYLDNRSPSGARNVLAAIKSSIDALTFFPEIGRVVDDAEHRRLPVLRYPYSVFYRIAGDELLILHIRHAARRPLDPTAFDL